MLEAVNVSLASLNVATLVPMTIAVVGALSIIVIDLIKGGLSKSLYVMIALLLLLLDIRAVMDAAGVFAYNGTKQGSFDVMLIDGLAILVRLIIVIASFMFISLELTSLSFHEFSYPEFFALLLFMIAGSPFMFATHIFFLSFSAMPPPCSIVWLGRIYNEAKRIIPLPKIFRNFITRSLDKPGDTILEKPSSIFVCGIADIVKIVESFRPEIKILFIPSHIVTCL